MKKIRVVFTMLLLILTVNHIARADAKLNERVDNSARVFEEIMQMPEKGIPQSLLKGCSGIAIFPFTIKGGFIWGGRYGQGVILTRDKNTGDWSGPAFFTIGGVSWGLQIGGEAIDLVLVLVGPNAVNGLLKDNFTLGADAAIAAGPVGRNADISSDLLLKGGVFSYSRSKGLFAGIALKGAVIMPNNSATKRYYSQSATSNDILTKKSNVTIPQSGEDLIETISNHIE